MKIFKRWIPELFPWMVDNPWELVVHCKDQTACDQYLSERRESVSIYEYMIEEK